MFHTHIKLRLVNSFDPKDGGDSSFEMYITTRPTRRHIPSHSRENLEIYENYHVWKYI
jgi:hypothetical protein